jgi:hypothetical protein
MYREGTFWGAFLFYPDCLLKLYTNKKAFIPSFFYKVPNLLISSAIIGLSIPLYKKGECKEKGLAVCAPKLTAIHEVDQHYLLPSAKPPPRSARTFR